MRSGSFAYRDLTARLRRQKNGLVASYICTTRYLNFASLPRIPLDLQNALSAPEYLPHPSAYRVVRCALQKLSSPRSSRAVKRAPSSRTSRWMRNSHPSIPSPRSNAGRSRIKNYRVGTPRLLDHASSRVDHFTRQPFPRFVRFTSMILTIPVRRFIMEIKGHKDLRYLYDIFFSVSQPTAKSTTMAWRDNWSTPVGRHFCQWRMVA